MTWGILPDLHPIDRAAMDYVEGRTRQPSQAAAETGRGTEPAPRSAEKSGATNTETGIPASELRAGPSRLSSPGAQRSAAVSSFPPSAVNLLTIRSATIPIRSMPTKMEQTDGRKPPPPASKSVTHE